MLQQDWSTESFDCLQIPAENKILILSMAKTRLGMIPTVPFNNMIDRKVQGLNILLVYASALTSLFKCQYFYSYPC